MLETKKGDDIDIGESVMDDGHQHDKPSLSYIALIAMAILSSPDKKMLLSQVYGWIMKEYPYFDGRGSGWRNSIRHNLSLNECFVKVGRAINGKGNYWAIHPACLGDFSRGNFGRRQAQQKVRHFMGLSVDTIPQKKSFTIEYLLNMPRYVQHYR